MSFSRAKGLIMECSAVKVSFASACFNCKQKTPIEAQLIPEVLTGRAENSSPEK
jgi:hypothetical protein